MISGMERIRSITRITSRTEDFPASRNPSGSIRNAQTTKREPHQQRAAHAGRGDSDSVGASPWQAWGRINRTAVSARPEADRSRSSAAREGNQGPACRSDRGTRAPCDSWYSSQPAQAGDHQSEDDVDPPRHPLVAAWSASAVRLSRGAGSAGSTGSAGATCRPGLRPPVVRLVPCKTS